MSPLGIIIVVLIVLALIIILFFEVRGLVRSIKKYRQVKKEKNQVNNDEDKKEV